MEISFRHNVMKITRLDAFSNIRGGFHGNCKNVYFVRLLGTYQGLAEDIQTMDRFLGEQMRANRGAYKRIEELPKSVPIKEIDFYINAYEQWVESGRKHLQTKTLYHLTGPVLLGSACKKATELYSQENRQMNPAIEKNFVVKLSFWFDFVMDGLMTEWDEKIPVKIVASNVIKRQEYLFFYMLTCVGFDVLLLQDEKDIGEEDDRLGLSEKHKIEPIPKKKKEIPIIKKQEILKQIPENRKDIENRKGIEGRKNKENRKEKSFEELARLAASVVLITIHDQEGRPIGSGSGIMIGHDGYILTNNHVLCNGRFYTIRIENDEQVYETDEVIKYHSVLDLAIIRINRQLTPIPVYAGKEKLLRGQKVVAIGSPLGLFNSVSDGIISGFRVIDTVDMIQFTAPISNGSSGGAVLNLYGEVIGISTAGFDYGQNINLAVGYECINAFIQGFISHVY